MRKLFDKATTGVEMKRLNARDSSAKKFGSFQQAARSSLVSAAFKSRQSLSNMKERQNKTSTVVNDSESKRINTTASVRS